MLSLRRSTTDSFNAAFVSTPRKNRSNASYVEAYSSKADQVDLLLLGGKGPVDFRLRVAQSHARDDMASVYRERISDERLRAVAAHVRKWLFGMPAAVVNK